MPSVLLDNIMTSSLGRHEDWPQDATIYQPYDVEQILLPDHASCLSVQTFLRMCDLPFCVENRSNAEFMSPTGRVPFMKCGSTIVAELDPIISFVSNKGINLTAHMENKEKADMRADMSLVNNVFVNAELYLSWVDPSTLDSVTRPRYGSVFPWPLNHLLTRMKRKSVISKLKALKWYNKTAEEVLKEFDRACFNLSSRLGTKHYFFEKPTELDALVFGHVYSIVTTKLPDSRLSDTIRSHHNLISHCDRIQSQFSGRRSSE